MVLKRGADRVLGMPALVRHWVPWVLQLVAVSGALACGALSGEPEDGAGGSPAAGGAQASGGVVAAVGGGAVTGGAVTGIGAGAGPSSAGGSGAGGGTSGVLPASIRCGEIPDGQIEPPCTADDLVAGANCASDLQFVLALERLELPLGTPLALVLLALDSGSGAAGSAGTPGPLPPLALEARDYPDDASFGWGPEFLISASTTEVIGRFPFALLEDPSASNYLTAVPAINGSGDEFHVGQVGILSGHEVVAELRLIIQPSFVCLIK